MTLLFIEGFDQGNNREHYLGKWAVMLNPSFQAGRYGGYCNWMLGSGSWNCQAPAGDPGTTNELIIGWACKSPALATTDLMRIYDVVSGVNTIVCEFELQTDGTIDLIVDATIKSSTTTPLVAGSWHYIEVKILLKTDATGSIAWQIDGVANTVTPTIKTINTSGTPVEAALIYWSGAQYMDDLYIATNDSSGLTDFANDPQVTTLIPSSDDSVQFDKSEATNWEGLIDLTSPISDTYNESNTTTHQDTFGFPASDIPATDIIHGVQAGVFAAKTDGGGVDMNIIRDRSTTTTGAAQRIVGTYQRITELWEVDADAGPGAWTVTNLDATKFGYKRV